MAKIVIDGRMLGWTGIGRYTLKLLEELERAEGRKQNTESQFTVLLQSADWDKWQPEAANFKKVRSDYKPYSVDEQLGLAAQLNTLKPDLVHFTGPNQPVAYRGKKITTVHDLTLVDHQNVRRGWLAYQIKYWAFRLVIRQAIKTSDLVITDTAYVADQVQKRYHLPRRMVKPVPLGFDSSEFRALPAGRQVPSSEIGGLVPDGSYLLYVGNAYPYKNLPLLITALARARQKMPHLKLVLVGPTDEFYSRLKDQAAEQNLGDAVIFTGEVSDAELAGLYRHASLYVFPSLSEGFGLPGLEAMGLGLPVLAANASCLPEVYGGAAVYFDPHSARDLASKITDLLAHPKKLEELKQAGLNQVGKYAWQKTAEQTLAAYNQLTGDI